MAKFIALLRGINVSGQKKIKMADLRALFVELGFTRVATYIQSGNVVFDAGGSRPPELKSRIEAAISDVYGFDVVVILRSGRELTKIISKNPYQDRDGIAHDKLYVAFLSEPVSGGFDELMSVPSGEDSFIPAEGVVYLHCPGGFGKTVYNNNSIEKAAGVPATTRNWRTVNRLAGMLEEDL